MVNFSVYLKISVLLNPKMCNVKLVDGIHWEVFSCLSNNSRYEMERTPQVILKLIYRVVKGGGSKGRGFPNIP